MRELKIIIERQGLKVPVGTVDGDSADEAVFAYAPEYLNDPGSVPISISLPLREEPFSARQTRTFFEGLLPEGFTRRSVAQWIHVDDEDYLAILAALGGECLGALQVVDEDLGAVPDEYEPLTMEHVQLLAREGATRSAELVTKAHLSLTGASGKAGLYYDEENDRWYLPKGTAPSTHIVKQSHIRLDGIVTNEQLAQTTARLAGLPTPDSFIINLGTAKDDEILLATRRFDRVFDEKGRTIGTLPAPLRLHQEDFAQALGIPALDKYEKSRTPGGGYLRRMFEVLRLYSANPIEDQLLLWDAIIFDYLIGNTDSHIKNFSLLYSGDLKRRRLAPIYDIVSTCIYESSTRDLAFSIGGKNSLDEIGRADFGEEAAFCGLTAKTALDRFDRMAGRFEEALAEAQRQLSDKGFVQAARMRETILAKGGIASLH